MRTILNMAQNTFGVWSAKYKEFGGSDLSRQSDSKLVRNARMMSVTAAKYLTNLASEGLTSAKITTLTTQKDTLDLAIDAQTKAISDREVATEDRIEILNALYRLLTKYTGTGQDIFYETDEAKYNDYVIYDVPAVACPPLSTTRAFHI